MKKGDLSINVIIVAAIALLVLVILSVIFMARMGIWTWKTEDCGTVSGTCTYGDTCPEGQVKHPSAKCHGTDNKVDPYRVCCILQAPTQ